MATAKSPQQWEELFHQYDKDNSGTLDIMELRHLLLSNNSHVSDSQIAVNGLEGVSYFDENGWRNRATWSCSAVVNDMFVFMAGSGVNKNSKISKEEFINGIQKIFEFVEVVTALFKRYDVDNNGYLSPTELRNLLWDCDAELQEKTIDDILKAADTNKDGQVSLEEFINALS